MAPVIGVPDLNRRIRHGLATRIKNAPADGQRHAGVPLGPEHAGIGCLFFVERAEVVRRRRLSGFGLGPEGADGLDVAHRQGHQRAEYGTPFQQITTTHAHA
jgi:hypothetical protein